MLKRFLAFLTGRPKGCEPTQATTLARREKAFPEGIKNPEVAPQNKAISQTMPAFSKPVPLQQNHPRSAAEAINDGCYVVKYFGERQQSDSILAQFEITCGPRKGSLVQLQLDNRLAKRALKERSGGWTEWMAFEGDQKCGALEHARSQAHEGQFMVTVKDGLVASILDPTENWEQVERQILKDGSRPIGGFQREGWGELVELALQYKVPLDLEFGPKPDRYEAMVPQGWEDGNLVLKKAGGRKVINLRRDGIDSLNVSEPDQGSWDFPPTMEAFVLALVRHPSEELKLQALSLLDFLEVSPENLTTWAYLLDMARSGTPKVRGSIADSCRSWTVRERKTVLGTSFTMITSIPAVFELLKDLSSDADAGVRTKACYALGDHPGTQAGSILEALSGKDPSPEVRRAATHALERVREFEKVRSDCEAALAEKARKKASQKASVS